MLIRFNPTATAVQFTGDNADEVKDMVQNQLNSSWSGSNLKKGYYYVAFMGQVHELDEQAYHRAQGLA